MDFLEGILVTGVNLLRHWKAFGIRKRFAVVHHRDAKARSARRFRNRHRDVPAPKQVQHRLRENRLYENFQRSAANQTAVVARLIVSPHCSG